MYIFTWEEAMTCSYWWGDYRNLDTMVWHIKEASMEKMVQMKEITQILK
jgi:hypothetical protein